jgi:hypothetical protein
MIVLNIDKVKKHKKSLKKCTPSTPIHSKTLQQIATKIKAFFIISYPAVQALSASSKNDKDENKSLSL